MAGVELADEHIVGHGHGYVDLRAVAVESLVEIVQIGVDVSPVLVDWFVTVLLSSFGCVVSAVSVLSVIVVQWSFRQSLSCRERCGRSVRRCRSRRCRV